jgi:hypothetical protein
VIRYVAWLRAMRSDGPEMARLLDPLAAEDELCRALGAQINATHEVVAVVLARLLADLS